MIVWRLGIRLAITPLLTLLATTNLYAELPLSEPQHLTFIPEPLRTLSGETITNILIRPDEDVWLSTTDSVYRFTGNSLSKIQVDSARTYRLPESRFESFHTQNNGSVLLVSHKGEVFLFDGQTNSFKQILTLKYNSTENAEVLSSYSRKIGGYLWIGSSSGELFRVDSSFGTTLRVDNELNQPIVAISENNGKIVAVSRLGHVRFIDYESGIIDKGAHLFCSEATNVASIYKVRENQFLFGTTGNGLWKVDFSQRKCRMEKLTSEKYEEIDSATVHEISEIKHNEHQKTIVTATDYGVFFLKNLNVVAQASRLNTGIRSNEVLTVQAISDRAMWLGTYTGPQVIKPSKIWSVTSLPDKESPSVVAVTSSSELGTFIADYDQLYRLSSVEAVERIEKVHVRDLSPAGIMSIFAGKRTLYVGLRNGDFLALVPSSSDPNIFVASIQENLGVPVSSILAVNDKVFAGTFGKGTFLVRDGKFEKAKVIAGSDTKFNLRILKLRNIGVIAISEEGISLLDLEGVSPELSRKNFETLKGHRFWTAAQGEEILWLADPAGGVAFTYYETDGSLAIPRAFQHESILDELTIFSIQTGNINSAYIATNRGIFYANLEDGIRKIFFDFHAQMINFDYGADFKDKNGLIFFGGTGGLAILDQATNYNSTSESLIKITKIEHNGQIISPRDKGSKRVKICLAYPTKLLTLSFSVIDFTAPQENRYRYKLHHFDETWVDGSSQGFANYTNVSPGKYTFHVQGANSAGVWDREGVKLAITVLPPWWRTWWAYAAYALLAAFIVYMIKRWYDANMLTKRAQAIADERTLAADAALDTAQAQLETHDKLLHSVRKRNLRTLDLIDELIQLRSSFLPDDVSAEIAGRGTQQIHALSLVERSLSYIHDRVYFSPRKFSADCLAYFTETLGGSFATAAINDVADVTLYAEDGMALALVMHELVANAFQHAFQHDGDAPFVRVTLREAPGEDKGTIKVSLAVEDNGSGLPESAVGDQPGLALVQRIVSHYKGGLSFRLDRGTRVETTFVFSDPQAPDSDVVSNP